jgi:hypothetical protein
MPAGWCYGFVAVKEVDEAQFIQPPEEKPFDPLEGNTSIYFSFHEKSLLSGEKERDGRFGIATLSHENSSGKNLTFDLAGNTNNVRLWVDGATPLLGGPEGQWDTTPEIEGKVVQGSLHNKVSGAIFGTLTYIQGETGSAVWVYNGIRVRLKLSVVKIGRGGPRPRHGSCRV